MRAVSLCRAVAREAARSVVQSARQRVSRSVTSLVPAASLATPLTSGRFSQAPTTSSAPSPRRTIVTAASAYSNCSVPDAAKMVTADKSHTYLDVRTPQEFQAGHVPGAINVPVMLSGPGGMTPNPNFVAQVQQEFPDPEAALCVGCKSGVRSKTASELLSGVGYTGLVNVEGGFDSWLTQGLPVER